MLEKVHSKRSLQFFLGLAIGFCFGFLLQKGGVTRYDVIMRQLLLQDWTVLKIILTAIITGTIGIYLLRIPGLAKLHTKSGSFGSTVIGGVPGMVVGAGIYATIYPKLLGSVLNLGEFNKETIPQIFGAKPWPVIAVITAAILLFLAILWIFHQ